MEGRWGGGDFTMACFGDGFKALGDDISSLQLAIEINSVFSLVDCQVLCHQTPHSAWTSTWLSSAMLLFLSPNRHLPEELMKTIINRWSWSSTWSWSWLSSQLTYSTDTVIKCTLRISRVGAETVAAFLQRNTIFETFDHHSRVPKTLSARRHCRPESFCESGKFLRVFTKLPTKFSININWIEE